MIVLFLVPVFIIAIFIVLDELTKGKSEYEKWLKEELERNPNYINWLSYANYGKDYKLGLKISKKIKKKRDDDK